MEENEYFRRKKILEISANPDYKKIKGLVTYSLKGEIKKILSYNNTKKFLKIIDGC